MKIGLLGAQGTGKTTLLESVHGYLPEYEKCTEVTRWVKSLGVDINEGGSDLSQQLVLMKHLENLFLHDYMITDRTLIDGYVYTWWLNKQGQVSDNMVHKTEDAMHRLLHHYDLLFYLPIEFDVVDDGVRSIDNTFRNEIDAKFQIVVETFQIPSLCGSIDQRVSALLTHFDP